VNNKHRNRTRVSFSSLGNFGLKDADTPQEGAHFMTK
jgi:hypothetical protein